MERYVKTYKKIEKLENIWDGLFSDGDDMTPYQSFSWNKNVADCYKSNTYIFLNFTVRYFVCFRDNKPVVIAPIALAKNKNGDSYTQLLGQYTKSGELNFVYGKDADDEDFRFLIEYIMKAYPHEIRFYEVGDFTKLGRFLSKYQEATKISDRMCVKCNVPATKEENYGALSKSVRQTIRTTNNRLEKDGIPCKTEIFKGYNFSDSELQEIDALYNKREAEWNNSELKTGEGSGASLIKQIIGLFFKNKDALINYSQNSDFVYVRCTIDGKLAGFFFGITDINGYCIVPTLAINSDYSKYSPGLLMIHHFLNDAIENESLKTFDLSRGDEIYKSRYLPNPVKYQNNDYKILP